MDADSKSVIALRWLSFVPGAFLVASIAFSVVYFSITITMGPILSIAFADGFLIDLLSYGVGGAAFVYAGARIAPSHRNAVALILAAITILFSIVIAYPAMVNHDWLRVIVVMALACGAGLIVYGATAGELNLDTH
jgi:hypothetical protein